MEGIGAESWPAIGIDLGTTNSCVAIWKQNRVEIIPNDRGSRTTPSCVAFTPSHLLIGHAAKIQVEANPTNTIYDSKRLIGRKFSDKIVQKDLKLWPFEVLQGKDDKPVITICYKGEVKKIFPEQISAMVLAKMKETAEAYLGMEVKNAVVTVPAYFNNSQRQATKDAGTIAGLNVMRIINGPTAAAIAYGLLKHDSTRNVEARNILVFDLGGGTFDVSLVAVAKGSTFEVKATGGDTHLGGVDFDNSLVNHCVDEFKKKHFKDINGNHRALERLRAACEMAKRRLSWMTETTSEVNCLYEGVDFSFTLCRDEFEKLNMSLFQKSIDVVQKCLKDAKMNKGNIDDVVLVGGSTRIPMVRQLLQEFFNGKELCKGLNADEAVASGAAIQAAILSGTTRNREFLVSDVNPFPLEVRNDYGEWRTRIPKNTPIPTKHQWRSTPIRKNMSDKVREDEKPMSKNTQGISMDNLDGIPPTSKDPMTTSIDTLEVDTNGIYTWTSVEKNFWAKNHITITKHNRVPSEDEINRMVEEAKKYKMEENRTKEDEESKTKDAELRKARLDLEKFMNNMSDTLSSYGMIKSTYKKKLKDSIQQTNRWLNLNSQLNDARMFEDKLKELQDNFTCENMMKEVKESKTKDTELRKARLDLEKFVSNISDKMSNYYNIKSEDKKKLKDAIQETNQWLDLNVLLNDASKFEDKLKELQDIHNSSSDASGMPKKSSFFFFSYEEDGESSSIVEDQKYEAPHEAEKETFKWLSSWMST